MPSMSGKRHDTIGVHSANPGMGLTVIGHLDGLELHLKEALKYQPERRFRRENEHLDAAAGGGGIEAVYPQSLAKGGNINKPLTTTPWGTRDFYVEDPDGYILCFGGRPAGG